MTEHSGSRGNLISVRGGDLADVGSWLYVWVTTRNGQVVYVGGTGLPPAVRTWLHLHDPAPEIGRVCARYPGAATEPLDVLVLRLPDAARRPPAKAALVQRLAVADLLADDYVGDAPPTDRDLEARDESLDDLLAAFVDDVAAHRPDARLGARAGPPQEPRGYDATNKSGRPSG